ncbi:hypothetical protein TIFTF001_053392 [Ficus carica]|uniref:Uncharacterized protein n=2 Tax=Ficus carica TaxID=3494 RepID=A0AA88EBM2_FICCA|nr:hypothetical protein TIFTF001_053392 [Ficus carica]
MNGLRERLARVEDFVGVPQSDGAESLAVQGEQQARTIASLREALQELSRTMTERFEMVVRNVESLAGGESSGTMSGESDPTRKSKGCFTCGGPHMAKNCPSKVKLSAIFAAEAARETTGVADDDEDVALACGQGRCDGGVSGACGRGRVRSVMVRTIEWLRGWLHERECSGADSRCRFGGFLSREDDFVLCRCGPMNGYVGGYMNENTAVQTQWISKSRGPMVRDWGLGGELHGQGWLGIGAKAPAAQHTIGIVVQRPGWLGTRAKPGKDVGMGQHMAATIRIKGWSAWFDADQRALRQTNGCVGE